MTKLRAVLHHPVTNILLALILIATSLVQLWESLGGTGIQMSLGAMEMKVGAYDGVLAYGIVHLLRAVAELLESVERSVRA